MKVDCDIPGLSVSCLNSNVGKGSLWVAERATSNPNIYEVSTAWDWGAFTQDELKAQLGIYGNLTFVPHYYMASSNARGVMAIAKRMATGGWEYSSKSADVVMNNILHLDKEHLWFVGCNPALQVGFFSPRGQRMPLVVANGSILLQDNELYYSTDSHAFYFEEGFKHVGTYLYPLDVSVFRALIGNVLVKTRYEK